MSPCQTVVNAVVSRLSYQQFMRAKKVGGDVPDVDHVPWVEEFKIECQRELIEQAKVYGVLVESFDVLDRELEGHLGKDLEKQAEQVLQNQIQATQIELRNHINTEKQRGLLEVARVEAEATKTNADTEFYAAKKAADAQYYAKMKAAEADAEASALMTQQEAKNILTIAESRGAEIRIQGDAYAKVESKHARVMQQALVDVEKRKAMPPGTIWFEGGTASANRDALQEGFSAATGVALANNNRRSDDWHYVVGSFILFW